MKILIQKKILFSSLSRIQGIVERVSLQPITTNILISAKNNNVVFSATNLQIGINSSYNNIDVKENGNISVNAKKLFEIIKELPESLILIEEKENYRIKISCGEKIKYTIFGFPPEEYPFSLKTEEINFIPWCVDEFINLIKLTYYCISKDETRPNISGLFIKIEEGEKTRCVTTDGYRLSIIDKKKGIKKLSDNGFIIPYKAVLEISRILNEKTGSKEVMMSIVKNSLVVKIEEVEMFLKLIDKKFPDYEMIVPGEDVEKIKIKIDKEKIRHTLKRITIISNDKNSPVKFSFKGKKLELFSEDSDLGSVKEEIEIENEIENEIIFFINGLYLLDFINAVDKNIIIEVDKNEEDKPVVVKTEDDDGIKHIIIQMKKS